MGEFFFPVNFCSVILFDYIESMAIFAAGQKIIPINIICTMRVAGLSEVFVQQKFIVMQYVICVHVHMYYILSLGGWSSCTICMALAALDSLADSVPLLGSSFD